MTGDRERLDALVAGVVLQLKESGDESKGTAEQRLHWLRGNLGSHISTARSGREVSHG